MDKLWVNKYAPAKIEDCVLPQRIKNVFSKFVEDGHCPNLLLAGSAGCGKTTVAKALSSELGADVLFINASIEGSIDVLRGKIRNFASTVSITAQDVKKIVILDEAEGSSTSQSFQPALRAFMEEFSNNCMFILTCNFKNRLIAPIHSRCSVVEFVFTPEENLEMQANFFKRILNILEEENITFEQKVVAKTVQKFFPDFRRLLNELQKYGSTGSIDAGILANVGDVRMNEVMRMLKEKNFGDIRKWAVTCADVGDVQIYRALYDALYDYMKPSSIPQAVLIINEYQYKSAFCADPEINLVAAMTEIMMNCEFK